MTLPLAADPTSPTPGFHLVVNLEPNSVSPNSQPLKALLIGPQATTGGDMVDNTEIRAVYSEDDVRTATGQSLVLLAYKKLHGACPTAQVDVVTPAQSAGATATKTVTCAGTITTDGTIHVVISGREIEVPWLVGESAADAHTKLSTYVGRYVDDLYCVPSVSAALVLTANGAGPAGNDITVRAWLEGCTNGTVTVAAGTTGTTEPDFTTAFGTVEGRQYDYIGVCASNADVASTTGVVADLLDHIEGLVTGPAAKLQQGLAGHTGLRTDADAVTVAMNSQNVEVINAQNAQGLPSELLGWEIGDRLEQRKLYISANRIGRTVDIYGSADPVADHPTLAESDAALLAGLSLVGYDETTCKLIRAITTYSETDAGAAVLPTDCNEIDAMYDWAKDLRAVLPVKFAGAKVTADATDTDDDLPEGVVECRDIKAEIVSRTESYWIPKGVINRDHFRSKVESGELTVQVNATDETQVDIYIPGKPFKNLAKMGVYMQKDG